MGYSLNFHQTFRPEKDHIQSLLSVKKLKASMKEISHRFGIPTGKSSGKVEVSLLYAQAAGLLQFEKKDGLFIIERTPLGDVISMEDGFLEHPMTQLLIHYRFCSINSLVKLWRLFFVDYRKIVGIVNITEFQKFAERKYNAKNLKTAPLIGTYISDRGPLVNLNLISRDGREVITFNDLNILPVYSNFYTYFIVRELEAIDSNRMEFTLSELIDIGFHNIFGWDLEDLRYLLSMVENKGTIFLNKQFNNYHIYLNVKSEQLLKNLFL